MYLSFISSGALKIASDANSQATTATGASHQNRSRPQKVQDIAVGFATSQVTSRLRAQSCGNLQPTCLPTALMERRRSGDHQSPWDHRRLKQRRQYLHQYLNHLRFSQRVFRHDGHHQPRNPPWKFRLQLELQPLVRHRVKPS